MYFDHALRGGLTGTPTALPDAALKALKPRPFWARMLDRIVEARLRKAEHEIRMHLHFIPEDVLKRLGYRATLRGSKDLPFARQ